jgi:hypothetical protein
VRYGIREELLLAQFDAEYIWINVKLAQGVERGSWKLLATMATCHSSPEVWTILPEPLF